MKNPLIHFCIYPQTALADLALTAPGLSTPLPTINSNHGAKTFSRFYSRNYVKYWKKFLNQLIPLKTSLGTIHFIGAENNLPFKKAIPSIQADSVLNKHLNFASVTSWSMLVNKTQTSDFFIFLCFDHLFDCDLVSIIHSLQTHSLVTPVLFGTYFQHPDTDPEFYTPTGIFALTPKDLIQNKSISCSFMPLGGRPIHPRRPKEEAAKKICSYFHEQRPALFLDRDGVIIEDVPYLNDPSQIKFIPEIITILNWAKQKRMRIFVVSNQSGIGRGKISEKNHELITMKIDHYLKQYDLHIDGWFHSPYHLEAKETHYRKNSLCRKPRPGMILMAMNQCPVNLQQSVMIGDKDTDILEIKGPKYWVIQGQYPLRTDVKILANQVFSHHHELVNYLWNLR